MRYPESLLTNLSEWRDPKTDSFYIVLDVATCSTNGPRDGIERAVIYWSKAKRSLRYREIGEFLDGRFVPIDEYGRAIEIEESPTTSLDDAGSSLAAHLRDRDPAGRLVICVAIGADDINVFLARHLLPHEGEIPTTWEGWPVRSRVTGRPILGTGEDGR